MVKYLPASSGSAGSIPGLGRSPGEGNGNPLQYFCLGNPMDRAAWAIVHGVAKESDTTQWVNNNKAVGENLKFYILTSGISTLKKKPHLTSFVWLTLGKHLILQ